MDIGLYPTTGRQRIALVYPKVYEGLFLSNELPAAKKYANELPMGLAVYFLRTVPSENEQITINIPSR